MFHSISQPGLAYGDVCSEPQTTNSAHGPSSKLYSRGIGLEQRWIEVQLLKQSMSSFLHDLVRSLHCTRLVRRQAQCAQRLDHVLELRQQASIRSITDINSDNCCYYHVQASQRREDAVLFPLHLPTQTLSAPTSCCFTPLLRLSYLQPTTARLDINSMDKVT